MRRKTRPGKFRVFAAGFCLTASVVSGGVAASSGATEFKPASHPEAARGTDNRALEEFLRSIAPDFKGQPGHWTFRLDEVEIAVVADEKHDRMRVLAPVGDANRLAAADLAILLDANFDRALDARYATRQGVVWALYVHPLSSLTKKEFESSVRQVVALRKNYGTTFSSTNLVFGSAR